MCERTGAQAPRARQRDSGEIKLYVRSPLILRVIKPISEACRQQRRGKSAGISMRPLFAPSRRQALPTGVDPRRYALH